MPSLKEKPCFLPGLSLARNLPCEDRRAEHAFTTDSATPRAMHKKWREASVREARPEAKRGWRTRAWFHFGETRNLEALRGICNANARAWAPESPKSPIMLSLMTTLQVSWCRGVRRRLQGEVRRPEHSFAKNRSGTSLHILKSSETGRNLRK